MNLLTLVFGAYRLRIVIFSSWIFPLMIMLCLSLSLLICFGLKSILSDTKMATLLAFWVYLMGYPCPSFYLEVAC